MCTMYTPIWMFPKMVVSPNHPLKNRDFHYKPSILGLPLFLETPIYQDISQYGQKSGPESVPLRKWNPSWEALQEITPEKAGGTARLRGKSTGEKTSFMFHPC